MSLNGELGVGLIGCPDQVPDLWGIADAFPDALKELLECGDDQPEDAVALLSEVLNYDLSTKKPGEAFTDGEGKFRASRTRRHL